LLLEVLDLFVVIAATGRRPARDFTSQRANLREGRGELGLLLLELMGKSRRFFPLDVQLTTALGQAVATPFQFLSLGGQFLTQAVDLAVQLLHELL